MTFRVLWVVKELAHGGTERLLLELRPHLPDVEFLPVAVVDEPCTLAPAYRDIGLEPLFLGARSSADVSWVRRFGRMVRQLDPTIVHFHSPLPAALGRLLVPRTVPVVYTEHSLWSRYHPLTRWTNAITYRRNDAIIGVSPAVLDEPSRSALTRGLVDRMQVIRNGVDIDGVRADAARPTPLQLSRPAYGTVGHLRFIKGIDVLTHASVLVAREFSSATGYVFGSGEDEMELTRIKDEISAERIVYAGLRTDARALMKQFDVFVLPSRVEGLPVALLEAMALGLPIVATSVGGVPEVIQHNQNGLVVPPEDPRALSEAIVTLLRDTHLARALGDAARSSVESSFTVGRVAAELHAVYHQVLERRGTQ